MKKWLIAVLFVSAAHGQYYQCENNVLTDKPERYKSCVDLRTKKPYQPPASTPPTYRPSKQVPKFTTGNEHLAKQPRTIIKPTDAANQIVLTCAISAGIDVTNKNHVITPAEMRKLSDCLDNVTAATR